MDIYVTRKQAAKIGFDKFSTYGHSESSWGWRSSQNKRVAINIAKMTPEKIAAFKGLFTTTGVYGAKTIISDIEMFTHVRSESALKEKTVANLRHFEPLLIEHLRMVDGHRVYRKVNDAWFGYFASLVSYHPAVYHKGYRGEPGWTTPEQVHLHLQFEHGIHGNRSETVIFYADDVRGKAIPDILANDNLYTETPKLRRKYLKTHKRFKRWFGSIGKQLVANGTASYSEDDDDRWWRKRTIDYKLTNARVVVDVLNEGKSGEDESDTKKETVFASTFWKVTTPGVGGQDDDEEETSEPFELPVHPYLRCFHLTKHMQMDLHISSLTRYAYDTNLINKLVIDDRRKALVKLLIDHRDSKYADIIGAKSGGAIVMLCGSPGTGKTLTAEVFAESEQRALYSVQCAQLGTTPEELENELLKVLARAQRWNAVLLLDECDVYVHKRGKDVKQNAMVGVFLRVLEYQNAVMFMTTNRAKDIDDAVASRCTARLVYEVPSIEDQKKIWRVLVDTASADMTDAEIHATATANPDLSGRDVKNLLKLAMLVSDEPITAKTIAFVRQFKPT